jgi:hypothetical protein
MDRRFRCATSSTRRDFKSLENVVHDFLSGAWAIDAGAGQLHRKQENEQFFGCSFRERLKR